MRKLFLLAMVCFMIMVNIRLYAQEKGATQGETEIKLELIWEKEFPEGIIDVAFQGLDNLMPKVVVTGNDPRWGCKEVYFFNREGNVICSRRLMGVVFDKYGNVINSWAYGGLARAVISQNGKYVGIFEPKKFTEKEGSPIGNVEIIDSTGSVVNSFPLGSRYYWVSPYGNEIIAGYPILNDAIFTIINKEGSRNVDLSKTEKSEYMLGDKFKVIRWENSNKLQDLVIVNRGYNSFMKASRFLYDAANDFGNGLLKTNRYGKHFAIRTGKKVSIFNKKAELISRYPTESGTGLAMSIDGQYLAVPTKLHGIYVIEISTEKGRMQKVSLPIREKAFNAFQPQALKGFHTFEITTSGKIVIDSEDNIWFNNKRRFNKESLDIKKGAKIIGLRVDTSERTLCIITNHSIRIYAINIKGGKK